MPWLPEVQALEVVMMRPVVPKNTPMFTAAVCDIILIGIGVDSPVLFSAIMRPKSPIADSVPAEEPNDTPISPS